MELKAQLKLLNKPAVKSIQTQHGDIDCVDMYKQPAFDHPLLKNHTIQMRPTSYPEGMGNQDPSNANLEIGLKDDGCPLGTVPIRRTKIQELMSAKSPSQFGRKNLKNKRLSSTVGHHHAIAMLFSQVYGTQATMNVWSPQLQDQGQFSLAQLWLLNGHDDQLNSIEAGWHVISIYLSSMSTPISCNSRISILVLLAISLVYGNARSLSKEEHKELKAHLKLLNKPAVKSIQTQYGDIDCVDMYKQPAFDHPLLKNHTIQMRPTSYPEWMGNQDPSNANLEIGLKDGGCPLGTVPIPRTKIQELMSAKSLSHFGRKNLENRQLYSTTGHHYAFASLYSQVYGTQVTMNVWSPQLQDQKQFSLAQLWLLSGPKDELNSIEAGWHVFPGLYGDSVPRLFVYWTADGYTNTGCYNLKCPGFVQVSRDIVVGSIIQPSSTYNGDQIETTFLVFKDSSTGNWWLIYGNTQVGYWPKSLFTSLADSASLVEWGGEVYTQSTQNPQMGSGHFPDEGFKKASYMKKLMFVDNTNTLRDIPSNSSLYQDLPQCYRVIDGGNLGGDWGRNIYFGGPGEC
ncbi:protein neprosin-like [Magnolia sinica]|uniref:protein neprosin-like n=1 Tax=Magnolia sinica TaxID=86752 RepID=UPI00265B0E0B|nr:protein neprosin-like [Magnolia sinica]